MENKQINSTINTIKSLIVLIENMEDEVTILGMYNLNKAIDYLIEANFFLEDLIRDKDERDEIELIDDYEDMGCRERLFTIAGLITSIRREISNNPLPANSLYKAAKWIIREVNGQQITLKGL